MIIDYTILGLAVIFFVAWFVLWFIHMAALIHASRRLYRWKKLINNDAETPLPGVSILKPITGVDPHLYNNLETFFQLNYPLDKYELLFCVQDKNDPAIPLIENLRMKNPHVSSSLFVGGESVGINPKINNLMPAYKAARFDVVMISDAGLRMLPETLLDMVSYLNDKTVLVHQLPFVCLRQGFAGILEMTYFGCQQARMYLVSDLFGFCCLTGMSFLVKKEILDDAGGLQAYGKYIGEDYFIAQTVLKKNLRTSISSLPALQNSGLCNVRAYQDRMIRWMRLRVHMLPQLLILEPIHESVLSGFLASWSVSTLFEWNFLVFFLIHLLVWFLLDYALIKLIQGSHLRSSCVSSSSPAYSPPSVDPLLSSSSSLTQSSSSSSMSMTSSVSSSFSPNRKNNNGTNNSCCCGGEHCNGGSGTTAMSSSGCFSDDGTAGSGVSVSGVGSSGVDSPDNFLLFHQDSLMTTAPTNALSTSTATTTKLRPTHSRSSSLTLSTSSALSSAASAASSSSSSSNTASTCNSNSAAPTPASNHPMQLSSRLNLNHHLHHHHHSNNFHHQRHLMQQQQQPLLKQQQQQQMLKTPLVLTPENPFPVSKFDFLIAWLFREFSVLYLFSKAISTNKVTWRTGAYRLEWGGTASAADAPLIVVA